MPPVRPLALLALVLAAATAQAKPAKKAKRGPYGPNSRVVRNAEAQGDASLRVRSIDLGRRTVVVEITGFPRAPAGNLFTFTDDRGRKFIAIGARCEDPFPSGARVCDLETPEGYERHPWVKIELHLHGLMSSTVAAPEAEVERAYEAARALLESPPEGVAEAPPAKPAEPPATSAKSTAEAKPPAQAAEPPARAGEDDGEGEGEDR